MYTPDNNKHSTFTKAVAPVVFAAGVAFDDKAKGYALKQATVRRDVMGTHVTYVIKNRMDVEMVIDGDSIDNLILALQQVRSQDQL